ncbi:MAG: tetratricopeptide repeat protein, partial [Leptospiraceae bacterium]|nr:tetratricopeptide repeat protein [Leptospiraceae bacterium]
RVALISTALDTGEEVKEEVKLGEFFGVKSSLGHYPREETAQVLGKTTVIVFKHHEFEQMVLKNTRLIMTMMRVFSRQLRDIHRQVRDILKAGAAGNPAGELLNVAESFYRMGNFDHAIYAFKKYIEYNPNGKNIERAEDLLRMARKGLTFPAGYPPPETEDAESDNITRLTDEQKMMSADDALTNPDALNAAGQTAKPGRPGIAEVYQAGMQHMQSEEHAEALVRFNECLQHSHLQNEREKAIFSQAHYQKGFVQMKLGLDNEASNTFSNYIKQFPTGDHVKECIFNLGIIAENAGNPDRARSLYHKVATMPPPDNTTQDARKRLEQLGS